MTKITTFVDYKSDKPPLIPKPDHPIDPHVVSVRDGVLVKYPDFLGIHVRVIHPLNPKAPSKNVALGTLYLPPHVGGRAGPHRTERAYLVLEGQGRMTFAGSQQDVKKDDFIFLPPGCAYAVENIGTEMLTVMVVVAKPDLDLEDSAKTPEFVPYETDEVPVIAPPKHPVESRVLSVRDGVPVRYRGCDGLGIRVIHPVNPKAASKDMGLVIVYVPPHTEIGSGSHEPEENYILLDGQGRMGFSNFERDVKKGDFVHLPAWCVHGLKNTGDESIRVLVVAAPPNP
jgi:mannose-6-phosphate isomerase-like protein (cupin superfamily)